MNKNAIQKYAIWARNELIEHVKQRAYQYGISEQGYGDENATVIAGRVLSADEKRQRHSFVEEIKKSGYKQAVEEVAYTWFNRFVALRYMEVNDFLPTHVHVFSDASGNFNPEILANVLHLDLPGLDMAKVFELLNANATEELYRYLLLTQCNALNMILPEMFERLGSYTEMLLPNNILKQDSVLARLVKDIPEEDWRDAVQIIGWLYQYYNEERKNEVINIYKGTVKKEDIPAATQLFTTDWVVRYMVDNSLGRYWLERNPQSKLREKLDFFVAPKDGNLATVNEKIEPTELTFFDPCMGSGHILVYAFDVLMEIYRECGYSDRDAAASILGHNLYGLDIDDRAYQLAYFAVMMRARKYDRRILTRGLRPNTYALHESYECQIENRELQYLMDEFRGAQQYGSLINLKRSVDLDKLQQELDNIKGQLVIGAVDIPAATEVIQTARILMNRYCVVCTNPPYLNKMNPQLKEYIIANYKDYSGDLFSAFMYKNFGYCKQGGYSAFMTPFVWMFIKTYEKLREYIIQNKSIATLVQMEYSAFEEATVPICSFVLKNSKETQKGMYIKLSDFKGGMEVQKQKVLEALADENCKYLFSTSAENFSKIPGSPIAYWVSDNFISIFRDGTALNDLAEIVTGVSTGDNNSYLRTWSEVDFTNISIYESDINNIDFTSKKWIPYNKGGEARKWYGNNDYIVKWSESVNFHRPRPTFKHLYLQEGLTWSFVTSGMFSARYYSNGFLWDVAGSPCVIKDKKLLMYTLAYLSTKIVNIILKMINPTINCQIDDIQRVPMIINNSYVPEVERIATTNVDISKANWDYFETSWDFVTHPLITYSSGAGYADVPVEQWQYKISNAYKSWKANAEMQFNQLKANEEELNRIFIDIYGLQDELTPEVEDKDVTVRRANLGRDIRSLISYAVGCMFGRYSLDIEGIAYAGGEWYADKYKSFPADKDNILPICDDEYFGDDIVGRFVDFVKTVYGADTLEENLKFIADAFVSKGTPREIIRNYFLNDFYKDHCKTYQKRPIYWLFDSGKKNGFKALIYMHRYSRDLLSELRTDYVHEQQERYRTQLSHITGAMNTATGAERARLLIQQDKLSEQAREIGVYEEKVHHLADQNIMIDLDDGVKKNYEIFTDVLATI